MDVNSLPYVRDEDIEQMQRNAEAKMSKNNYQQPAEDYQEPEYVEEEVEQEEEQQEQEQEPVYIAESQGAKNFRIMRERMEKAEREAERISRERDEAVNFAMSQGRNKDKQQTVEDEPDLAFSLEDDALMEGKHGKRLFDKASKNEKQIHSFRNEIKDEIAELKLRSRYSDLDDVVSPENMKTLRAINPELYEIILQSPDLYKRGKTAYESIKQWGIHKDKSYEQDKILAHKNALKPKTLASISPQQSPSPLSRVNGFANSQSAKDAKDRAYRDMMQAIDNL